MSRIGIIANPHSKLNKRNPDRQKLLGYIVGEKGRVEVTKSLEELKKVADDFCEKGVNIVAINGGDGTISRTLTAIINAYEGKQLPQIALLRGGTMNVVASELGIKGLPEQVLYRLIEAYSSATPSKTEKFRTLCVDKEKYGFLFGNGAAANFLEEFYKNKAGPIRAISLVFKLIASRFFEKIFWYQIVENIPCTIKPKNLPEIKHNTCAVFCSTVRRLPLGFKIFSDARKDLRQFQCISVAVNSLDLIWKLPYLIFDKKNRIDSGKISFNSESVELGFEKEVPYQLDGELYFSKNKKIIIEVGPELDFIIV